MKRSLTLLLILSLLLTALPAAYAADGGQPEAEAKEPPSPEDLAWTSEAVSEIRSQYAKLDDYTDAQRAAARNSMKVKSANEKEIATYVVGLQEPTSCPVTFFNGNQAVAYIDVDTLFQLYGSLKALDAPENDFELDTFYGDRYFAAVRENGTYILIDFQEGLVFFDDYDLFGRNACTTSGGDLLCVSPWQSDKAHNVKLDKDGRPLVNLLSRAPAAQSFVRRGYSMIEPLAADHIPIYWHDGKGYLPVTTFGDLFLSYLEKTMVYNGKYLFICDPSGFDNTVQYADGRTMKDIAFRTAQGRSEDLAEYNYWEMVMYLDGNYGLREAHQINGSFDDYFQQSGLKPRLLSTDADVFSEALSELVYQLFGDLHSAVNGISPYVSAGYDYNPYETDNMTSSQTQFAAIIDRYYDARGKTDCVDKDGNPIPYREVGDTAYITFDGFSLPLDDYYSPEMQKKLPDIIGEDTIALIWYANRQIQRENSPIKNVVIDLSCNLGGSVDTSCYVISWVLGTCPFNTVNDFNGAQYTARYTADVDLDGRITKADSLDLGKVDVYCLTSGCSFSMGNYTPAAFRESGQVTLLGSTSGGGSCVVQFSMTADGTPYQFSSRWRMSTVKNGSFYDIDQGIQPDIVISKVGHYYDRQWLTEFIDKLP